MELQQGIPQAAPSIKELGGEAWSMVGKTPERSFNASLGYSPKDGYALSVRKSNYKLDLDTGLAHILPSGGRKIMNIIGVSLLDENMNPKKFKKVNCIDGPLQQRGVEDCRLFWREDGWYFHGVFLERSRPRARIAVYKLDGDLVTAKFIKLYESERGKDAIEKNWMTELVSNSKEINFIKYGGPGIRGGSSLIDWEDGHLALVHKTYSQDKWKYESRSFGSVAGATKHYRHMLAFYDKDGNLKKTSPEFTFRPQGQIEFGMGLVEKGEDLYMSLGVNDEEVWMAKLSKSKTNQLLEEKN